MGTSINISAQDKDYKNSNLNLASYYQNVLSYYPLLKKQKIMTNEAGEFKKLAASYDKARVMINASYINSNDPVTVFGSLLRQNNFSQSNFDINSLNEPDPVNNFNMTLYAELPVFNAYQTKYSMRMAEYMAESSQYSEEIIKQQILLMAEETYLNTLLSSKILNIVKACRNKAMDDMKQADELKTKGVILGADFYSAKVIFSNIDQMLNQVNSQIKTSNAIFNILMGEKTEAPVQLSGKIRESFVSIPSLDELLSQCESERADLHAIRSAIKAKESELEKEKSTRLPKVSAFTSAEADTEKLNGTGTNYTAGIKGSFDLFDAGYKHRTETIRLKLEELKNDEILLKDELYKKVYVAFQEYNTTSENLKVFDQSFQDSKESIKLLEPLYNEGKKSIADLMQLRVVSLNAEISSLKARFQLESAALNLLFSAGILSEKHLNELSNYLMEA